MSPTATTGATRIAGDTVAAAPATSTATATNTDANVADDASIAATTATNAAAPTPAAASGAAIANNNANANAGAIDASAAAAAAAAVIRLQEAFESLVGFQTQTCTTPTQSSMCWKAVATPYFERSSQTDVPGTRSRDPDSQCDAGAKSTCAYNNAC